MTNWFALLSLVVAAGSLIVAILAVISVVMGRQLRAMRQRRWADRDKHVRPLLLQILDGVAVTVTGKHDRRHLMDIVVRASHNVRGNDRVVLASWLRSADAMAESTRLLRSRSSLKRARGVELFLPIADGHAAVLERLLTDKNRAVRSLACEALGRAAAVESIPALLAATGPHSPQIPASLTVMAIIRMNPHSAWLLLDPAASMPLSVQTLAVELVGTLNLLDGRTALEQALGHPAPEMRITALLSLARLGLPRSASAIAAHHATTTAEEAALRTARAAIPTLTG